MTHILAFRTRPPANGPVWLADYDRSIVDLFRRMMPAPFVLHGYDTAELPPAANYSHSIAFDHDEGRPVYSDGAAWFGLAAYDADVAALAGLTTTGLIVRTGAGTAATRTLTGPAAGITVANGDGVSGNPTLALANDLAALEALSGTSTIYYRSAADTWSAVTIGGNLGFSGGTLGSALGTAAVKNTGTSGDAVPLLNGANTWSAMQIFTGAIAPTAWTDVGAATATTLVPSTHAGRIIRLGGSGATHTISPEASNAWANDTIIIFMVASAASHTLAQGAGVTLTWAGSTGNRTLAGGSLALLIRFAADSWVLAGSGIT